MSLHHAPVAVRCIAKSIKEVIEQRYRLLVDGRQYRDFMAIQNINKFIQFEVVAMKEW